MTTGDESPREREIMEFPSEYSEARRAVDNQIATLNEYKSTAKAFLRVELGIAGILLTALSLQGSIWNLIPNPASLNYSTLENTALKVAQNADNLNSEQGIVIALLLTGASISLLVVFLVAFLYSAPKYQMQVIRPSVFHPDLNSNTLRSSTFQLSNCEGVISGYNDVIDANDEFIEEVSSSLDQSFQQLKFSVIALVASVASILPLLYQSGVFTVIMASFLLSFLLLFVGQEIHGKYSLDEIRTIFPWNVISDTGLLFGITTAILLAFFDAMHIPDILAIILIFGAFALPIIGIITMEFDKLFNYTNRNILFTVVSFIFFGVVQFVSMGKADIDEIGTLTLATILAVAWVTGVGMIVYGAKALSRDMNRVLGTYVLDEPPSAYLKNALIRIRALVNQNSKQKDKAEE